jgi:hypothetical protein
MSIFNTCGRSMRRTKLSGQADLTIRRVLGAMIAIMGYPGFHSRQRY